MLDYRHVRICVIFIFYLDLLEEYYLNSSGFIFYYHSADRLFNLILIVLNLFLVKRFIVVVFNFEKVLNA